MFGNLFSGPIPSELGALDSNTEPVEMDRPDDDGSRNISKIFLWGNALTGTVPPSLGLLTGLQLLEIYDNTGLTGGIPTSLCGLETWPEEGGIKVDCEFVNCSCDACLCE